MGPAMYAFVSALFCVLCLEAVVQAADHASLVRIIMLANPEANSYATVLDSPIRETTWVGDSDQIVFTITLEGHLWRSMDGGMMWLDLTAAGKIFFRGAGETHWVTEDFGGSFRTVTGPAGDLGANQIRLHKTEGDWILAIARRWVCWASDGSQRRYCADDLFVTKDFGTTWTNLTAASNGKILSFSDFDWGWDPDTILAAVYQNQPAVQKHLEAKGLELATGWDQYVDFVRSTDLFASGKFSTQACGNQFEILNGKVFLAVSDHCADRGKRDVQLSGVKLQISEDYGASFHATCFPLPLSQHAFSVVDSNADSAFINVDYNQGPAQTPYGTVFVSDANFTLFSTTLQRNTRSPSGSTDFIPVQHRPTGGTVEDDVAGFSRSLTKRTSNGGGEWQVIQAPLKDSEGNTIHCLLTEGCSLHLHGTTSWGGGRGLAFVYSHFQSPGLMLSTGNVGTFLYEGSVVNTYLSRDGGETWEEMRKGAYIYEFGDSGGVIVMAKHGLQGSATEVMYSLDEGTTWEKVPLPGGQSIDVSNIRVEPDNQGKKFIVQGMSAGRSGGDLEPKGVLFALNFGEGFAGYKLCGPNDYEFWSPTPTHCLLGKNITYQRQYRSARCWNGDKYTVPGQTTPCPCEAADYQCDYGSDALCRPGDGGCLLGNPAPGASLCQPSASLGDCPLLGNGYAFSSNRKRVVAGDQCVGRQLDVGGHYVVAGRGGWGLGGILLALLLTVMVGGTVFGVLAYRGMVPDSVMQQLPCLERLRYRNLRSNFQSLAQDFGLNGGDAEFAGEQEMRRPG